MIGSVHRGHFHLDMFLGSSSFKFDFINTNLEPYSLLDFSLILFTRE